MHSILDQFGVIFPAKLRERRWAEDQLTSDSLIKNQIEPKSVQVATKYHSYSANYWYQVRTLLIIILSLKCFNDLSLNRTPLGNYDSQGDGGKSLIRSSTVRLTRGILQVVILVAAAADSYADASAESPSIDALEDEDEDDEELDASASNEYPDGDNDNDESYEDSDDDRQESRVNEDWLAAPVHLISHQQPRTDYDKSSIRNSTIKHYTEQKFPDNNFI